MADRPREIFSGSHQFHGQFTFSPHPLKAVPSHFEEHRFQDWHLAVHPVLPVRPLRTPQGQEVGFALGWVIQGESMGVDSTPLELPAPGEEPCEEFLKDLAGRFLLVILDDSGSRAYPDPFASLAAVYSSKEKVVSSTTSLLNYRPGKPQVYPRGEFPDNTLNAYYPAGLTDTEGCFRLLPNHVLDLDTWNTARFWPRTTLEPALEGTEAAYVEHAARRIRKNMIASRIPGLPVYSPMTGGKDSRIMLACTPPEQRAETTYITFSSRPHSDPNRRDLHTGRLVARRHGLRHRVLPLSEPIENLRERYLYTTGRVGGGGKARKFHLPALEHLDLNAVMHTGFGGGSSRRNPSFPLKATLDGLYALAKVPKRPGFREKLEEWLNGIPSWVDPRLGVDLFALEIRRGCWASPHLYGLAPFRVVLTPYADRRFLEACFTMPFEFRTSHRGIRGAEAIIAYFDPSLLRTPFERMSFPDRVLFRLRMLKKLGKQSGSLAV